MKFISFEIKGRPSYGAVVGERVVDLAPVFGAQAPDLKALIAQGLLGAAADAVAGQSPALDRKSVV